jgi:hypothetical protein
LEGKGVKREEGDEMGRWEGDEVGGQVAREKRDRVSTTDS